jgi:uncharacterized protein
VKDLLQMLVERLVEFPDEVEVREQESGYGVTYQIYVAEGDTGKVIGRGGRIIQALRAVAKAAATRDGVRVNVELMG